MHDSTAVDEGVRLQSRKAVLVAQAETIIDMAHVIEAKLEVACRKLGSASHSAARHRSKEHKHAFLEKTWTACKHDGGRFEVLWIETPLCSECLILLCLHPSH